MPYIHRVIKEKTNSFRANKNKRRLHDMPEIRQDGKKKDGTVSAVDISDSDIACTVKKGRTNGSITMAQTLMDTAHANYNKSVKNKKGVIVKSNTTKPVIRKKTITNISQVYQSMYEREAREAREAIAALK